MGARYRGGDVLTFRGDLVMLGHFADRRPLKGSVALFDWRFNAGLSKLWREKPRVLDYGKLTVIPTNGKIPATGVFLAGLGPTDDFNRDLRRDIYRRIFQAALGMGAVTVAAEGLEIGGNLDISVIDDVEEALESIQGSQALEVSVFINERSVLDAARKRSSR